MFNDYIGLPFKNGGRSMDGTDCFGLVYLVYKHLLQKEILIHKSSALRGKDIEEEYLKESSEHWELVSELQVYDVIAMAKDPRMPNIVQHFGIYVGNGKMLHTLLETGSHIVKVKDYSYCIKSYHRYKG